MVRLSVALGWLLTMVIVSSPVHAQSVDTDFGGQMQTTLPTNEQLVGQIQDAFSVSDVGALTDDASDTTGIAQDLAQQLADAMTIAPDDAARSRIEAVLTHTRATLAALRLAHMDTTLDAARGHLDEARGEAVEGLNELRPFVLDLVGSGVITGK